MAGFTPDEGELLIADILHKGSSVDRTANLQLGLFTDTSPAESITEATVSEPTGGGYARITLTDATWNTATAAGVTTADYAQQTFTVAGTDYTGTVKGYFIATQGTTPRILYIEVDPNGPYQLNVNDTYKITPNLTIS